MKRTFILCLTAMLGVAIGLATGPRPVHHMSSGPQVTHAQWSSAATTIDEQSAEANVIVHVRAREVGTVRAVEMRIDAASQKSDFKVDALPFSDSRMEVVKTYKGSVPSIITVMQTGGQLAATERHPSINMVLDGDPLFVGGQEHVLFLKDISGDEIHAKDRALYQTVNPAGRYDIESGSVAIQADSALLGSYSPPTTLEALEAQIERSLGR